jgi:hypothetical protein
MLQEWLAETSTMWGLVGIIISATIVDGAGSHASQWIYRVAAALLVALAVLTGLTGARTPVVWFKICPVLLTFSAALLLVASLSQAVASPSAAEPRPTLRLDQVGWVTRCDAILLGPAGWPCQRSRMGITAHAAASAINGIMMSQVISVQAVAERLLASTTQCRQGVEEFRKPTRRTG